MGKIGEETLERTFGGASIQDSRWIRDSPFMDAMLR